jgi:predicted RNA methylase
MAATATTRAAASLSEKCGRYWTPERIRTLCGGRDFPLSPEKPGAAPLLRVLGFMGADGRIGSEVVRKYTQINKLVLEIERALSPHVSHKTRRPMRIVEFAAGQSHLSLLLAYAAAHRWGRPAHIVAVDRDPKRLQQAEERAYILGFSDSLRHRRCSIDEFREWPAEYAQAFPAAALSGPPHCAVALHACDIASDSALAHAMRSRATVIAVAPCCQAELSRKWAALPETAGPRHPLGLLHWMPGLRSDAAALVTDAMRIAILRANGYSVTASDFVAPEHTPKNRLIVATRLQSGTAAAAAVSAAGLAEYTSLKQATGGAGIALEALAGDALARGQTG